MTPFFLYLSSSSESTVEFTSLEYGFLDAIPPKSMDVSSIGVEGWFALFNPELEAMQLL